MEENYTDEIKLLDDEINSMLFDLVRVWPPSLEWGALFPIFLILLLTKEVKLSDKAEFFSFLIIVFSLFIV